jgi:23S rRNA pseudouridine1911/1915/1917 synthase
MAIAQESTTLHRVAVAENEAGERLDRLLAHRLGAFSRTRLKRLIETRQVSLDGATITDPSFRVKPGQGIELRLPPPENDTPEPQAMALGIVFEDEHLLVLEKPAGLVVHPAPGNPDRTLVGGVKRPGIVHRLDKDTSGLMVVAKSDLAHHALSAAFANRDLTRSYLAVVRGVPLPRQGEIDLPIGRSPQNRKKMAVVARGKPALTRYRVERSFGLAAALLECRLATGRTHQIRVHLTAKGHPLIGDPTYGNRAATAGLSLLPEAVRTGLRDFPRQALHANVIGFRHPASQEYLSFSSPLPKDMVGLITLLESI